MREVLRLGPTLLIGSVPFAPETVTAILQHPIPFLAINPRSLADIENDIRTLGRLVDRQTQAKKLILGMRQRFKELGRCAAKFSSRYKPVVYCEAWPNPRISSPPWVAELVEIAGGRNAVPAGARVTDEEVAEAQPDTIVLAWAAAGERANPQRAMRNPLWKNLPAVRNRRVIVIRDELLNTPGLPLLQGAHKLFCAMHPQACSNDKKGPAC